VRQQELKRPALERQVAQLAVVVVVVQAPR
jgi:hypothetical protein